jgi:hypothetical protein
MPNTKMSFMLRKTKERKYHIKNTADPSQKIITTLDPTHQYTMSMQQTSLDTPGNTKDGLRSRNTRISCSSLTTKHAWYIPHSKNLKLHLKPVAQNVIMRNSQNDTTSRLILIMPKTVHSNLKHFKNQLKTKTRNFTSVVLMLNGKNGLVERSNGTLCAAARSMLNHAISRWDNTITAECWPFAI